MSGINPKRVTVFVCMMATIAIFIQSALSIREQQRAAMVAQQQLVMANEASARRAAQDAATEQAKAARDTAIERAKAVQEAATKRAQFLARYLNSGLPQKPGSETVAIAVVSEDGKLNRAVTDAIAGRFKKEPVEIISSLFKPEFVSDGLFNDAFTGSGEILNKLELAKSLDALLLARQDVQYSTNPSLQNVVTATMQLKVTVVPVSGRGAGKTWTFTAYGPGFTKEVARQAAEERLIKQIADDTKMSLNLQNH
jgi:hypothetical protein